jgi:hypothetical protein
MSTGSGVAHLKNFFTIAITPFALASLARAQAAAPQIDAAMHDYVDILRARGVSWTRIGAALGVSKQSAWERFSGED